MYITMLRWNQKPILEWILQEQCKSQWTDVGRNANHKELLESETCSSKSQGIAQIRDQNVNHKDSRTQLSNVYHKANVNHKEY